MRINPFLSPYTKVKSKWIKELHIKPETLKLIEEKVGKSLEDMDTGEKFLNRTAMACTGRSRIDKWDLIKLHIILPENPAIPLLGIYPENVPTGKKNTCSTMFIAALFIIARSWKEPDVPQQRNGYRKCGTFTQWSTTQLLKRMNL